jgi:hypothetical protein
VVDVASVSEVLVKIILYPQERESRTISPARREDEKESVLLRREKTGERRRTTAPQL